MFKAILLAFALILTGCGSQLVDDSALPAFESNYPTAEFSACGELHHGLAVCQLNAGDAFSKVDLRIRGYYQGTVKVSSLDCPIVSPEVQRYQDSREVKIEFDGNFETSCVIEFVVLPEYPRETNDDIQTYNLKGLLYIKENKGPAINGTLKHKVGLDRVITLNIGGGDGQAELAFFGCNSSGPIDVSVSNGRFSFKLSDVTNINEVRSCVLNGGIRFKDKRIRITYLASFYEDDFTPLPTCSLDTRRRKVRVNCPRQVSIISVNDEYKLKRESSFRIDKDERNVFRAVTVKGRSVLAVWNPQRQEWIWKL